MKPLVLCFDAGSFFSPRLVFFLRRHSQLGLEALSQVEHVHRRLELLAERRKSSSLPEKESFSNLEWVAVISSADCLAPRKLVDLGWLACDCRGGVGRRRCMSVVVWAHNFPKVMQ